MNPSNSDDLNDYFFEAEEQPPEGKTIRCRICGTWSANLQKAAVHQVVHQRRRCRWCGDPFSANSICHHEKFCVAKLAESAGECEGWEVSGLFAGAWLEEMCSFLQSSDFIPDTDGRHVLVVVPGSPPMWMRSGPAVRYVHEHLNSKPVCVVPSSAIRRAAGA